MEVIILAAGFVIALPVAIALIAMFADPASNDRVQERPQAAVPALNRDTTSRAAAIAFAIWLALTAAGEYVAVTISAYPLVMSDKGAEIEHAFRALTIFAVPVAAMVLAVLTYSVLKRGVGDFPDEDGLAIEGKGSFPKAWLAVTIALTLTVMIYPGLTALPKVIKHESPDLVVNVKGVQWTWLISYPDRGVANTTELVLPVNRNVQFNITSGDVLHSFWIPAFLMKIDAIPGKTTTLQMRPTETGEYDTAPALRLQCSQLCGLSHSTMRMPVTVVSQQDFDTWLKAHQTQRASLAEEVRP